MITLNSDQIEILGKPNFSCAPIAKHLIAGGLYDKAPKSQKAEYEQAVFIHWANDLYSNHGESWRKVGGLILKEIQIKIDNQEKAKL